MKLFVLFYSQYTHIVVKYLQQGERKTMKLNRLLVLAAAFVLGLSACNGPKADDQSVSGIEGSDFSEVSEESQEGSEEESSEEEGSEEEVQTYVEEGTTNGFPTQAVETFLTTYNMDLYIPEVANTQTWNYEAGLDTENYAVLYLWTEDSGEIGVDSLEDQYKALLEEAGVEVDDSLYNYYGYVVWDENDNLQFCFYTYKYEFDIIVYGPEVPRKQYDEFPVEVLNEFFELVGTTAEIPAPVSEYTWIAGIDEDDDIGQYFWAETQDDGSPYFDDDDSFVPGDNAIEDAYKEALETAGWTIDDSEYDDSGYYADKDGVVINFFSWAEEFTIYIYLEA